MSDKAPESSSTQDFVKTNLGTIVFMVVLSLISAIILSILASALAGPKQIAKDLDRSKQMMIATKVLSYDGKFILPAEKGDYESARLTEKGVLVKDEKAEPASNKELIEVYNERFLPRLVNDKGEEKTFKELGIDESQYLTDYKKSGYYKQPWKLIYQVRANNLEDKKPIAYVIPVNGYGLWDAIFGYLAIKPDGNTVIGATWYDQKETPGLGALIAEASWQDQFAGKKIFQESSDGTTDFKTSPLGLVVIKGKVQEVLSGSSKAKSALDGMTGATLTGNGVNDAYKAVLGAYRPFLIKIHEENKK